MRAVELFAGVGGFRQGLERAGHSVVFANEYDKYACDVYDYNYQGERIDRRDLTTIPATDIPAHDIICGGFPCQSFSVAGKRKGFEETRGTLFFDIMRLAQHHRTPYLLLENVKGLLNHDGGRTFETILETLDELGYDCQWQVLNSKNFGVPQNRERVIIVANLRGQPRPEVFPIGEDDNFPDERQGQISPTITSRYYKQGQSDPYVVTGATKESAITQEPRIATHYGFKDKPVEFHDISPTLKAQSHGHEPMAVEEGRIRRLTPTECERLQAFPDFWTKYGLRPDGTTYEMSDTQRYKQMGNAVTTNVIEAVARRLPL